MDYVKQVECEKKSTLVSLLLSSILWLIFLLVAIFIPVTQQKKDYKTISITLPPLEKELPEIKEIQPIQEEPIPVPLPEVQVEKNIVPDVVAPKDIDVPVTKPQETPSVQKSIKPKEEAITPSQPIKSQPLVKSMEELIAENANKKTTKASQAQWDESLFENSTANTSKSAPIADKQVVTDNSKLEGSIATASTSENAKVASSSKKQSSLVETTSSTTESLNRIASAIGSETFSKKSSTGNINYETVVDVSSSNNSVVSIALSDGSTRGLLEPASPTIIISPENEGLLSSSLQVTISFVILADGSVPVGKIEILPTGLLPFEIQAEVKAQVSRWRFERGQSDGHSYFIYSINKGV